MTMNWEQIVKALREKGFTDIDGNKLSEDPIFIKIETLAIKADKAIEYLDKMDAIKVADKLSGK